MFRARLKQSRSARKQCNEACLQGDAPGPALISEFVSPTRPGRLIQVRAIRAAGIASTIPAGFARAEPRVEAFPAPVEWGLAACGGRRSERRLRLESTGCKGFRWLISTKLPSPRRSFSADSLVCLVVLSFDLQNVRLVLHVASLTCGCNLITRRLVVRSCSCRKSPEPLSVAAAV